VKNNATMGEQQLFRTLKWQIT